MTLLEGKRILITGGTGSLGKVLLQRILSGTLGRPKKVIVLSRDEAKQHALRIEYKHRRVATDDLMYRNFDELLELRIGDVRDFHTVAAALVDVDIVFNAAALKQVPACEYFPYEALRTNVGGPENIVRAIRDLRLDVGLVVGVSTDKAVHPVNVMGMTKALQERVLTRANLDCPRTRTVLVRYGNVLASRGSVIPLMHEQIRAGGPVTLTDERMTRFLLSLEEAVDVIMAAVKDALPGETYVPRIPAARIIDVARALIADRETQIEVTGIRPGEKLHESLVSEEEGFRTYTRGAYYVIAPILPELRRHAYTSAALGAPYTSNDTLLSPDAVAALLQTRRLTVDETMSLEGEILR